MGTTTVQEVDYMWAWKPSAGGGASMRAVPELSAPRADNPSTDAKEVEVSDVTGGQPRTEIKTLKALVGRRRYEWLKEQYKRVGLFLWTIPSGHFALSTPNTSQEPAFGLTRILDGSPAENNILSGGLRNDTTGRYSHTLVFGRAGGGKDGRRRIVGLYVDSEMIDKYKLIKRIAYEENDIKTQKAADHLARRYAADARRNSRSLVYTVSGHSAISLDHPGQRRPYYVNSMVRVIDQKTGIDGDFYLGDIEFKRSMTEGTITRLTLYWPEDLVFAEEAA
jgi:prophage tail gpP-like protein